MGLAKPSLDSFSVCAARSKGAAQTGFRNSIRASRLFFSSARMAASSVDASGGATVSCSAQNAGAITLSSTGDHFDAEYLDSSRGAPTVNGFGSSDYIHTGYANNQAVYAGNGVVDAQASSDGGVTYHTAMASSAPAARPRQTPRSGWQTSRLRGISRARERAWDLSPHCPLRSGFRNEILSLTDGSGMGSANNIWQRQDHDTEKRP